MSRISISNVKYVNASCHTSMCYIHTVTSKIARVVFFSKKMSHVPFISQSCHIYRCGMSHMHASHTGWRRLIGSPKLQIIFHKRATKYRALLRKMTYKDKGSYESSPPCTHTRRVNSAAGVLIPGNESCYVYQSVISHMSMRHVTHA